MNRFFLYDDSINTDTQGRMYPDDQTDETYVAVTLYPASLKSLCLKSINKNRVDYSRKDIPEPDMLPLLWKAHSPEQPENMGIFLRVLDEANCQNQSLRAKKKQKN